MIAKPIGLVLLFLSVACGSTPNNAATPLPGSSPNADPTPSSTAQAEPPVSSAASKPEPEAVCEKDSDCTIFADCCACRAVSSKAPLPPSCEGICGESKCEVKGKTLDDVACVAGHCKLK